MFIRKVCLNYKSKLLTYENLFDVLDLGEDGIYAQKLKIILLSLKKYKNRK